MNARMIVYPMVAPIWVREVVTGQHAVELDARFNDEDNDNEELGPLTKYVPEAELKKTRSKFVASKLTVLEHISAHAPREGMTLEEVLAHYRKELAAKTLECETWATRCSGYVDEEQKYGTRKDQDAKNTQLMDALRANQVFHTPIALRRKATGEWDEYEIDAISRTRDALAS